MSSLRDLRRFKNISTRQQGVQDGPGTIYNHLQPGESVQGAGYSYLEKFPQSFRESTAHIGTDDWPRLLRNESDTILLKRLLRVEAGDGNRQEVLKLIAERVKTIEAGGERERNEVGTGAAAGKK
jgi:hypothetical protein